MQTAQYAQEENWPPAVLASCRFQDKTYGLPVTAGSCGLWYNQEMFEQRGIPAGRDDFPKTWDELRRLSKAFTFWQGDRLEIAGFIPWHTAEDLPIWSALNGSQLYDAANRRYTLDAEPNDDFAQATRLVLGGYVRGIIDGSSDVDVFRVSIPKAGTYTFETSAVRGACGFALEEATVLRLYDGNQVLLQEGGAVDPDALNFCSRITHPLEPGDHFLEVRGQSGDDRRYQLRARAGG
jgi:hypothetical protein